MAVGAEIHTGYIDYELIIEHTPSGNRLRIAVDPYREDGTTPSESTRDQIYQAFLNKVAEISNTTIVSSVKRGKFSAPVTPA